MDRSSGSFRTRVAFLVGCLGMLAACGPTINTPTNGNVASIGLDYASTSLGFRNSGALSSGRLMLWDTEADDLVDLESDIPLPVSSLSPPADLAATNVNGVTVSSGLDLTGETIAEIGARVSGELVIDVRDATRETSSNAFTALSSAYRARQAEGVDAFRTWRVADATGNTERFRYVLLIDPVRAASESVRFKTEGGASVKVNVVDTAQGDISVSVADEAAARCRQANAERAVCFVNAKVLRVFLNANGNLDYEPVSYSRSKLAQAFRKQ
jgi:hypothetical protein